MCFDRHQIRELDYRVAHDRDRINSVSKISRVIENFECSQNTELKSLFPSYHHLILTKMPGQSLWLRCEKKEFERRAALTPTTAKRLIDAGFDITVECDEQRIFDDSEYEAWVACSKKQKYYY